MPDNKSNTRKYSMLVIASETPSNNNGSGVIINRLLCHFNSNEMIYLGRKAVAKGRVKMPFPVYSIPAPSVDSRGERFWRLLSVVPGVIIGLYLILKYRPSSIVCFFPFENALLITYILHKLTGKKYYPYLNDLYMENRKGHEKAIADWLQPRFFRNAKKIIVVNEGMKRFYRERYGIESEVIFTSINDAIPVSVSVGEPHQPFVMGYSGNINRDRIDPFQVLIRALRDKPEYKIRMFSGVSRTQLEKWDLWSDNVSLEFFNNSAKLVEELSKCDLLYLPLTFRTDMTSREQLATCLGIKSYEYLISGVPVMVHCPLEYYTAQFYVERNCGLVVGSLDEKAVEEAIWSLRNKIVDSQLLVNNSLRAARAFTGELNADKLRKIVSAI